MNIISAASLAPRPVYGPENRTLEQRRQLFREDEAIQRILYDDRRELERELHFPPRYHEAKRRNDERDAAIAAAEFGRSAAEAIDLDEWYPSDDEEDWFEDPVPHGPLTEAETRFNAGDTRPITGPFSEAFYNTPRHGVGGDTSTVVIKDEPRAEAPIDTPAMAPATAEVVEIEVDAYGNLLGPPPSIDVSGPQYINPRRFNRGSGFEYVGNKRKREQSDKVFKKAKDLASHSASGWADFEEVHFRDLSQHPLGDYAHDEL